MCAKGFLAKSSLKKHSQIHEGDQGKKKSKLSGEQIKDDADMKNVPKVSSVTNHDIYSNIKQEDECETDSDFFQFLCDSVKKMNPTEKKSLRTFIETNMK